jgi:FkbM family methyltransferase
VRDKSTTLSIGLLIGDQLRLLTLRTGRIGDLFVLYEILAFEAYRIPPSLVAPRSVETIVDCGANIGLTSLYFASVYPRARIYSIEADPVNFAALETNVSSEPRITPIHACVVGRSQTAVAFASQGPAWGRQRVEAGSGPSVPALTLDELLAKFAIGRINLLKLDIEGAEREVLATGNYLDVVDHIVAELHDRYRFSDFERAVQAHGLRARASDSTCGAVTAHRLQG